MRNAQINILSANDDVTRTGSAIDAGQVFGASFHIICSDTDAAGTVKLQCSNDIPNGPRGSFTPTNWVDIPSQTVTLTAGGQKLITIAQMNFSYIRCVFTQTTPGTGTINVIMNSQSA